MGQEEDDALDMIKKLNDAINNWGLKIKPQKTQYLVTEDEGQVPRINYKTRTIQLFMCVDHYR